MGKMMLRKHGEPKADGGGSKSSGSAASESSAGGGGGGGGGVSWSLKSHSLSGSGGGGGSGAGGGGAQSPSASSALLRSPPASAGGRKNFLKPDSFGGASQPYPPLVPPSSSSGGGGGGGAPGHQHHHHTPSAPARIITTFRGAATSLAASSLAGDDFTSSSTEFSLVSSQPDSRHFGTSTYGGGDGNASRISKLTFEGGTNATSHRLTRGGGGTAPHRRSHATSRHSSKRLSELTVNKLQFVRLGRLYGRDTELAELHAVWDSVSSTGSNAAVAATASSPPSTPPRAATPPRTGDAPATAPPAGPVCQGTTTATTTTPRTNGAGPRRGLVTISGESGTGKSALVEGLRSAVHRDGGFFLVGKFPQQLHLNRQSVEPYAALAQACAELSAWVVSFSAPDALSPSIHNTTPPATVVEEGEVEGNEAPSTTNAPHNLSSHASSRASSTTPPTSTARRRGSMLPFTLTEFRNRIHRDLGSDDAAVLLRVMPCLLPILNQPHLDHHPNTADPGDPNATTTIDDGQAAESVGLLEAHHQFKRAFRRFLRAVTSWGPVALVLDDLQWADAVSMELLEALLTDREQLAFLAVGLFRNDDVYCTMPHLATMESLEKFSIQDSTLQVTHLEIGNLGVDRINELLVDLLSAQSEDDTRPLAECVHKKTLGNVFFVVQFLTLLQDTDLLSFNLGVLKWTWDLAAIQASTAATDNVVGLMMRKMKGLPPSVGRVLPVMACLGSSFGLRVFVHVVKNFQKSSSSSTSSSNDSAGEYSTGAGSDASGTTSGNTSTLAVISDDDAAGIMDTYALQLLSRCEAEGFIEPGGGGGSGSDYDANHDDSYHWVHDKIQEAAFSLIGDVELLELKLQLGKILYESFDGPELDRQIFTVANLLSADDPPENTLPLTRPIEVAQIFLRAGVRANENSAFEQAAGYFTRGIGLLPVDHWDSHYDLSLELFSTAAEAEFCNGNFEMMRTYCNEVTLQENQPLLDKKRVFSVLIDSLLAEQRCSEALAMARYTLARLGCKFPDRCVAMHALAGIIRIKTALKKSTTPEQLALLPDMQDQLAVWTMELLDKFITAAYLCKSDLLPLAIFRGLSLTVKKGVSLSSPGIFALVGLALAAFVGDYRGGESFASQSVELLKRVRGSRKVESRVYMVTHLFVFHWLRPISLSIKPLLAGYEVGMTMGDTESASRCIYWNLEFSFRTGRNLEALKADCAFYADQLREVKQLNILTTLLVLWQCVLHLTGENTFRGTVTGEIVSQERILEEAVQDYEYQFGGLYRMLMYVAFVCDEHEIVYLAMKKSEMDKGYFEKIFPGISGIYHLYAFNGLSMVSLYRETKEKKYLKLARRFAGKIKQWAMAGVRSRSKGS